MKVLHNESAHTTAKHIYLMSCVLNAAFHQRFIELKMNRLF